MSQLSPMANRPVLIHSSRDDLDHAPDEFNSERGESWFVSDRPRQSLRGTDDDEEFFVGENVVLAKPAFANSPASAAPEHSPRYGWGRRALTASAALLGAAAAVALVELVTVNRLDSTTHPSASITPAVSPPVTIRDTGRARQASHTAPAARAAAASPPSAVERPASAPAVRPSTPVRDAVPVQALASARSRPVPRVAPPPSTSIAITSAIDSATRVGPPVAASAGVAEANIEAAVASVATAPSAFKVAAAPSPPAPVSETAAIERVLGRYRSAFRVLDVSAAQEVWPAVNTRALNRAFEQLEEQTVSFERCQIDVRGARAKADCNGTLEYVPKVGSRDPHVDQRRWVFNLQKTSDDWVIDSVAAR